MSDRELDVVLQALGELGLGADHEELERRVFARLRTEVAPREDADHRRAAVTARRPRVRRYGWRLVLTGVAIAVVALVVSGYGLRGGHLDAIAQARAALAPSGDIVYMSITTRVTSERGATSATTRQWLATGPTRWRLEQTLPRQGSPDGSFSDATGPLEGRQEFSYADGEQRQYDAERDTLEVNEGYDEDGPAASAPGVYGLPEGDPATALRAALSSGDVRDEGMAQVEGQTVRRFVSTIASATSTRQIVYLVDPETFAPVSGESRVTFTGSHLPPIVTDFHVDAYQRLPLTDDTAKLLTISTEPGTRIVVHTSQQLQERERLAREGCKPSADRKSDACPTAGAEVSP